MALKFEDGRDYLVEDVEIADEGCSKSECTETEMKKKEPHEKKILNDCDDADSGEAVEEAAKNPNIKSARASGKIYGKVDDIAQDVMDVFTDAKKESDPKVRIDMIEKAYDKAISDLKALKPEIDAIPAVDVAAEKAMVNKILVKFAAATLGLVAIAVISSKVLDKTLKISLRQALIGDAELTPLGKVASIGAAAGLGASSASPIYGILTIFAAALKHKTNKLAKEAGPDMYKKAVQDYIDQLITDLGKYKDKILKKAEKEIAKLEKNVAKNESAEVEIDEAIELYVDMISEAVLHAPSVDEYINENIESPEERQELAQRLMDEAAGELQFDQLLEETAEEMYLDEGYVKNQLKAHSITHGKLMKEAKKHANTAKAAVRQGSYKVAVSEQKKYVDTLKKLVDECNDIEDDTRMIAVANSVMTGLFTSLAAGMLGASWVMLAVVHKANANAKDGEEKIDATNIDPNNDEQGQRILAAGKEYVGQKTGKFHIAATAVAAIAAGIVAGKRKYDKTILKYAKDAKMEEEWSIPKSRVDAQQRLRRMLRLAENVLKEYEDIAKVESK